MMCGFIISDNGFIDGIEPFVDGGLTQISSQLCRRGSRLDELHWRLLRLRY